MYANVMQHTLRNCQLKERVPRLSLSLSFFYICSIKKSFVRTVTLSVCINSMRKTVFLNLLSSGAQRTVGFNTSGVADVIGCTYFLVNRKKPQNSQFGIELLSPKENKVSKQLWLWTVSLVWNLMWFWKTRGRHTGVYTSIPYFV